MLHNFKKKKTNSQKVAKETAMDVSKRKTKNLGVWIETSMVIKYHHAVTVENIIDISMEKRKSIAPCF